MNAETILKEAGEKDLLRSVFWSIATAYHLVNKEKALGYAKNGLDLYNEINYYKGVEFLYLRIVLTPISLKRIKEINPAFWRSLDRIESGRYSWFDSNFIRAKDEKLKSQNKPRQAMQVLRASFSLESVHNTRAASVAANELAKYYREFNKLYSAIEYALFANQMAARTSLLEQQIAATDLLSQCYEQSRKKEQAFEYLKLNKSFKEKSERLINAARLSEPEVQSVLKKSQREIDLKEQQK